MIGAEITPTDAPPVVLWATDRAAYGRLCRLITRGRRRAPKGECCAHARRRRRVRRRVDRRNHSRRARFSERGIQSTQTKAPRFVSQNPSTPRSLKRARLDATQRCMPTATSSATVVTYWRSCTAGRTTGRGWINCRSLHATVRLPLVAAGDVHYHVPARMVLYDVLTAIRHGTTVAAAEGTVSVSQRRAASAVARRRRRDASPSPAMPSSELARSPTAAASRSTNCGTNIRPSSRPKARRRSSF